ncbi:MAG: SMP-30/gluconolactonase/LRE family protein [Acidobacteria bacterium]|nr:SMP-30/gluconolactonase/LRE family protein [Acidobacteriota bacterium]
MTIEPVPIGPFDLAEGPLWDAVRQRLLFVDIMQGHVHALDPGSGRARVYDVGQPVGAVVCSTRGDWLIAAGRGFSRLDPDSGRVTPMADAAPGRDDVRMNDGAVDPWGRFWAGTLSLRHERERGALYRLDADGRVHTILEPVTTSNGIDWSPDLRIMYYVDTRTGRVDQFDVDGNGEPGARRPFAIIAPDDGRPDGLVVDAEGYVWVALWQGGALRRYAPDGALDRIVALPVALVTKCAFAGSDLGDLYVTTARTGLSAGERADQPLAGRLFRCRPGTRGRLPYRFAG